MPKPLPHHWRKLTSHKLSSANDIGQASTIPRNSYVVTVKNHTILTFLHAPFLVSGIFQNRSYRAPALFHLHISVSAIPAHSHFQSIGSQELLIPKI